MHLQRYSFHKVIQCFEQVDKLQGFQNLSHNLITRRTLVRGLITYASQNGHAFSASRHLFCQRLFYVRCLRVRIDW